MSTPTNTQMKAIIERALMGTSKVGQISKRIENDKFVIYHINVEIVAFDLQELQEIKLKLDSEIDSVRVSVYPEKKKHALIVIHGYVKGVEE